MRLEDSLFVDTYIRASLLGPRAPDFNSHPFTAILFMLLLRLSGCGARYSHMDRMSSFSYPPHNLQQKLKQMLIDS